MNKSLFKAITLTTATLAAAGCSKKNSITTLPISTTTQIASNPSDEKSKVLFLRAQGLTSDNGRARIQLNRRFPNLTTQKPTKSAWTLNKPDFSFIPG
jgi:hypothetical protein